MKRIFKWIGLALGVLILLPLLAYGYIYYRTDSRFNQEYRITPQVISIPSDSASLALGRHIAAIKGCGDCHGADFGGKIVIDDPAIGLLVAPNITSGEGGLVSRHKTYRNEDFIRAIKHGIGKDNKTLKLMPAYEYNPLSQKDMGALIAYVKSLPPVNRQMPAISLNPLAYVLTHLDKMPLVAAEKVDHNAVSQEEVVPQVSISYGQYVAVSCTGCHQANLKGGDPVIPGSPQVSDITSTGNVGKWTEAQFMQTLRTGLTPEGKKLEAKYMPWPMTKEFTDTEIKSLYLFLRSLKA